MQIRLIRSATLVVEMADVRLLIDPWLAKKGEGKSYSGRATSPLVDLPLSVDELLHGIDAVLVSHLHSDHFDDAAQRALPKSMPILCHGRDKVAISQMGFEDVRAIGQGLTLGSVRIRATDGKHGPPEVLDDMGEVSGFLIEAPGEPRLYWAGDTILCPEVKAILADERPDVVVVHGCSALWKGKGPLVMDGPMVLETVSLSGHAKVVVTHLDAVDHATVSRADLRQMAATASIDQSRLLVPEDGEILSF
ncbi:MBL fold metallo-hydrolase [Rhizobium rosettiformans]|uniref:MBL fold metallo-hydrolase n=1 Tax=Rhizobium rosettiformans TaxID=1368430 RepID=A0ABX7EXV5_9HYPH|nr:MBL fold metallo-hydrolase [Rhizobium rosettiformans]QRF52944.1 MBL fold metallo-hydrolase [Rhizobium rosettiformans]